MEAFFLLVTLGVLYWLLFMMFCLYAPKVNSLVPSAHADAFVLSSSTSVCCILRFALQSCAVVRSVSLMAAKCDQPESAGPVESAAVLDREHPHARERGSESAWFVSHSNQSSSFVLRVFTQM